MKDLCTRREAMTVLIAPPTVGYLNDLKATDNVLSEKQSYESDLGLPANIFVDVALPTAEASVANGVTFKLVSSKAGVVDVRRRSIGGSDLLYQEHTVSALAGPSGAALVGADDGNSGSLWSNLGGFITYHQSSDGSAIVGFSQAGPSAALRSVQDKLRDTTNPRDYGAVGDMNSDDTNALQDSIDSFGLLGGELDLGSSNRFLVTDNFSSLACLNIKHPVSLVGKGGIFSAIAAAPTVPPIVPTIRVSPELVPSNLLRFENIFLGDPSTGTRGGGVGLHFVTNNRGITLAGLLVEGVFVSAGAAEAFVHDNSPVENVTGGLFCSEFRRNFWVGGMRFGGVGDDNDNGTGDNLLFTTNTTTGPGIGIDFTGTIDHLGNTPSQALFINHNSTSQGGAVVFRRANFPTLQNANIEQTVPLQGGVSVNFLGDRRPNNTTGIRAPSLTNSLVSAFTETNLDSLVNFGSCSGGIIWNNFLCDGGKGASADVVVSADAHDVWIGPNLSLLTDLRIVDNGTGTRGVTKTLALLNSWAAPDNGQSSLYCWKDIDGAVHLAGGCKNGITLNGSVVAILPIGFRPAEIEYFLAPCLDDGRFSTPATMTIQTNGEIQIIYCPTDGGENAQFIWPKVVFRAAHANTIQVPSPFII